MEQYCETNLNYAGRLSYEPTSVRIRNGRTASLDFQKTGFARVDHRSAVENWRDFDEVKRVHMPEIVQLCREFTGCDTAVAYEPLIRSPRTAMTSVDYAPIESVHSDYTEDYRAMVTSESHVYQEFLSPLLKQAGLSVSDLANASRLMVLQFWRNIGDQNPDRPLALCDASTVQRDEMIPIPVSEYGGQKLDFYAFAVRAPDDVNRHHWYTFPTLNTEETLMFRTYDSLCEEEGRAFYTPHTAFRDPTVGPQAPQRESVEMRALCVFA